MKKLFTSLLLLAMGVVVANAASLEVGGISIDLSTSKTYTSSDISAIKSGSVAWNPTDKKLTLKNVTINNTGACITAADLGTSASDRFYIYIDGSATLKSSSSHGMRFDDCYVVIYGTSTAYFNIQTDGGSGWIGIDAEKSNLNIWSIGLNIKAPNSTGIYGNKNYGSLTFIGTYGDITAGEAAVEGFKNFYLDDCLIYTSGAKFTSGTGITNNNGTLLKDVDIRPLLRVAGASVRTASNSTSGTNWKWSKSDKSLTITGDITASSSNSVIENFGTDGLVIKWEGTPTLKNGSTSSGSIIMSKKSLTFSGYESADITKALNLSGYLPIYMDAPEENTLTFNNATLTIDGAGYGMDSQNTNTNLVINKSTILVRGVAKGSIAKMKSCQMTNSDVYTLINPGVAYRQSLHGFGTPTELFKGDDYLWIVVPTESYNMEVLGKPVTNANMTDITVDGLTSGKITFDDATNTLSFDNVKLTAPSGNEELGLWIGSATVGKAISLSGTNEIKTNATALSFGSNVTFNGSGNMTVTSTNRDGISTGSGANVTIATDNYFMVYAKRYGYYGDAGANDVLTLKKSTSDTYGYAFQGTEGAIYSVKSLVLDNMDYMYQNGTFDLGGCYFDNNCVRQNGGNIAKGNLSVAFHSIKEKLGFSIGGKEVNRVSTGTNYKIAIGSKYITAGGETGVLYDPATKKLVLDNATINTGSDNVTAISNTGNSGLTISVKGNNTLKTTKSNYGAFYVANKTTISSETNDFKSSLTCDGGTSNGMGIYMNGSNPTLTVQDKAVVNASGTFIGIGGNNAGNNGETLNVNNASVYVTNGGIWGLKNFSMSNAKITIPDGGYFNSDAHCIVASGSSYANKVLILSVNDKITAIDAVEVNNDTEVRDIYDAGGRQLEGAHKGLNIIRMKDGSVKKVMVQ